jgi:S-disulfanyl-L-cysteine oxidoreductase SoxD
MSRCNSVLAGALLLAVCWNAAAQGRFPGVGRAATPAEVAAWDIDVRADFKGLPPGSGSVRMGEEIWEAKCASCHGAFGESNATFPPIAGGTTPQDIERGRVAALARPGEQRTTLMKLAHVSALWDYINRAMPWNAPKTLAPNEVYALTAYVLNLGGIVPEDFELSERNIAEVQRRLPNRHGLTLRHGMWHARGVPDVKAAACMQRCGPEPRITSELPAHARGAHGNLAEQNRLVGLVRGAGVAPAGLRPADPAKTLAEKSGCLACHAPRARLIGPSTAEIAARYRTDSGAEARLAEKVRAGGQGAWGSVPMPPNPQLREQDVRTLVRWILTSD